MQQQFSLVLNRKTLPPLKSLSWTESLKTLKNKEVMRFLTLRAVLPFGSAGKPSPRLGANVTVTVRQEGRSQPVLKGSGRLLERSAQHDAQGSRRTLVIELSEWEEV